MRKLPAIREEPAQDLDYRASHAMSSGRQRGRIRELVAMSLRKEKKMLIHFQESLQDEAMEWNEWNDWCTVCHQTLGGYEDERCFICANSSVCSACVQTPDPGHFVELRRWDPLSQRVQVRSFRLTGQELVCLQCGLFSSDSQQEEKIRVYESSCRTVNALLSRSRPFGLLALAFLGLTLCSRVRKRACIIENSVAQFLTYAEEVKFFAAIGSQAPIAVDPFCSDWILC